MGNAIFCLIPRGRRLGSYRFLEALKSGCIPLILSNGWVLPFSDQIDWQKAVVLADERLLTLIPTIIREFSHEDLLKRKQQVLFLWNAYFASVDKIVHTVLKVLCLLTTSIMPVIPRAFIVGPDNEEFKLS